MMTQQQTNERFDLHEAIKALYEIWLKEGTLSNETARRMNHLFSLWKQQSEKGIKQ
jgi:hypothetical protein